MPPQCRPTSNATRLTLTKLIRRSDGPSSVTIVLLIIGIVAAVGVCVAIMNMALKAHARQYRQRGDSAKCITVPCHTRAAGRRRHRGQGAAPAKRPGHVLPEVAEAKTIVPLEPAHTRAQSVQNEEPLPRPVDVVGKAKKKVKAVQDPSRSSVCTRHSRVDESPPSYRTVIVRPNAAHRVSSD